jgi:hypothetical protein
MMYGTGGNSSSATFYIPAYYYVPDTSDYDQMLESIEKYIRSRAWKPAAVHIRPTCCVRQSDGFFMQRRIAPAEWTGKNFKKGV